MTRVSSSPWLSIVLPFFNEPGNAAPLIAEIGAALGDTVSYEIVAVDDGSTDATGAELRAVAQHNRLLRVIVHQINQGQSGALVTGVLAARGVVIATLDGDGQNPPAELPRLLTQYRRAGDPCLVVGRRTARQDGAWRLFCSRFANNARQWVLHDRCDDTGCSLKIFSRAMFLSFPRFDHMHRFLPALAVQAGAEIVMVDVAHRARRRGVSKYGVANRLWTGIVDLAGVAWLSRRHIAEHAVNEQEDNHAS